MNSGNDGSIIRRVAIALNNSLHSSQTLRAAVELAAILEAELEGIFIEDINLIHLAELPFAREIRPASMTLETLDPGRIELELRSQARQEQQKLESIAREWGLRCSFRTMRGQIRTELMQAVAETDVLMLSMRSPQDADRFRRSSSSLSPASLPLLQANPSISVIFGPGQNEKRALLAAAGLADRQGVNLNVLLTGDADAETQVLRRKADTLLDSQKQVHYIPLPGNQIPDLVISTASLNSQVLLVNSSNSLVTGGQLWHYLEQVTCPVLIVREQA